MYSVKEAAKKIGISDGHCRRLLERGEIEGKKLGHDWVVLSLDYKRKRKPKTKKGYIGKRWVEYTLRERESVYCKECTRLLTAGNIVYWLANIDKRVIELTLCDECKKKQKVKGESNAKS